MDSIPIHYDTLWYVTVKFKYRPSLSLSLSVLFIGVLYYVTYAGPKFMGHKRPQTICKRTCWTTPSLYEITF